MEMDDVKIGRRSLLGLLPALPILPAGLVPLTAAPAENCGEHAPAHKTAGGPYQYRFFTPEEVKLLDAVMEKIIPADEHSPGAHEAKVVEFADLMVSSGSDLIKQDWRSGVRLLAAEIQRSGADDWLQAVAEREHDPQTVLDIFFQALKQMTINGYYTSAIGIHQELQYQGNTYVAVFTGCDHPEHKG
jgi:hypothetical protein